MINRKAYIIIAIILFSAINVIAQKKPLDHSVYDGWTSVSGEKLTNNGRHVVYNINPQEGDGNLVITDTKNGSSVTIPRGYRQIISPDQQYVVFMVKPLFADTRKAKIDKKKAEDMPKDSLGIVKIGTSDIIKIPYVKSFKLGKDASDYFAYLSIAPADTTGGKKAPKRDKDEGYPLIVRNLKSGAEDTIKHVVDYKISNNGKYLTATLKPNSKDTVAQAGVVVYDFDKKQTHTLASGKGEYKSPVFDETGLQIAFIADRDTSKKDPKIFELYYYKQGNDSATIVADKGMSGIPENWSVGEHSTPSFSKDGTKLFFGIAPVLPPKDTTIVDFEVAKLDIWHWGEPDLPPMQLKNLDRELKRTYLSVIHTNNLSKIIPLADEKMKDIRTGDEGNAAYALGMDDSKYRIKMQWEGSVSSDIYLVSFTDGSRTLVKEGLNGYALLSPKAEYITWYDRGERNWYAYSVESKKLVNLTAKIGVNFWNEKHDTPSDPNAYGAAAWLENDKAILIYDAYDIWQIDPTGENPAINLTAAEGRKAKITFRYFRTDPEARFIKPKDELFLSAFDNTTKMNGLYTLSQKKNSKPVRQILNGYNYSMPVKAKDVNVFTYKKGNFNTFPDLYVTDNIWKTEKKLTDACPQMRDYNWGTAELVSWKTDDGITSEGILYKPEDFDPAKKYPMLVYFYEKDSDNLYRYMLPAPSRSVINFPYFVSNGYLVFVTDIYYTDGHPGQSAYKSIVPGVKSLFKYPWVDQDNIAIQGQSWGGYQVAYLVTQTNMFKAAGAGAPVVNMTSAYGGIRWGTGMSRQFQYEHTQSRIGKTLWDGFDLYIENSPLFFADKVETPLLIMHNDNDGAVPWYQGIEYFTALRRLGKKVWMLQYNNEEHNLMERKNAKDLSIRLQQFFDHYLKGEKMPEWMKYGLPATKKGRSWGYELVD